MYSRHTERPDNAEGVFTRQTEKRTKQTEIAKGVHPTNGNKATGCILYETSVICHFLSEKPDLSGFSAFTWDNYKSV